MPSNFSPHVPVKTSTYQNRGADYWLYGPQLKARAQGLGLQMAGAMRSDITGIHEADMPYVKTLTERVSRKRDGFTEKILDGADINDQLISSMVQTFTENKDIQGSIKEAKLNNQKIGEYKKWAFEKGITSGDRQYYDQWMSDSIKNWGGTFKDGQVNSFEMAPVADYEDIIGDFTKVIDDVKEFMTPEQKAGQGIDWYVKPHEVKDKAGNVLGTKLMIIENKPGVFHTNRAKIEEELNAFSNRFDTSKDPEKRGQYADFLDFRTREDGSYLPIIQSEMADIARRNTFEYTDPDVPNVSGANFIPVATAGETAGFAGMEGVVTTAPHIMQASNIPLRDANSSSRLSAGTDFITDITLDSDNNPQALFSGTSTKAGNDKLASNAEEANLHAREMIGMESLDKVQKAIASNEGNTGNVFIDWLSNQRRGQGDAGTTKEVQELLELMDQGTVASLEFSGDDVLFDKLRNTPMPAPKTTSQSRDKLVEQGQSFPSISAYSEYGMADPQNASPYDKLDKHGKELVTRAEDKYIIYDKLSTLYGEFLAQDPGVDSRSIVALKNKETERHYINYVTQGIESQPYSAFEYDGDNNTYKELGNSFLEPDQWKPIVGLNFSPEIGGQQLVNALQNPGTKIGRVMVHENFETTASVSNWENRVEKETWDALAENQDELKKSYKNANIISASVYDAEGKNPKDVKIVIGTGGVNPYSHPSDSPMNVAAYNYYDKQEGTFKPGQASIYDLMNVPKETGDRQAIELGWQGSGAAVEVEKVEGGPHAYKVVIYNDGEPTVHTTRTATDWAQIRQHLAKVNWQILTSKGQ